MLFNYTHLLLNFYKNMTFCLNTKIISPEKNISINNAVILLHGYGGDGNDISALTLNWQRFLPNTIFLCPDGHQKCGINPSGFQWFDLTRDDQEYILNESINADIKVNQFIEEIKIEYKLKNYQISLCGFSQGSMLSINLGVTNKENFSSIVGFSGKIINKNNLLLRIKSKTKILLIHGDQDEVVNPTNLLEAKDFLVRNNIPVETNMIKNCGHHISVEASSLALNFIKKNFKI